MFARIIIAMRVVCSWCGNEISPEDGTGGKDSHGICAKCAATKF